ncbi:OFA family MFS transporter [Flavisolibacter sp. BT320]|nr:OFA family MFS transporter [Flavisolibacter longurius]
MKNKWLMALAGMSLQLSIGSVYAYSVWVKPIQELTDWEAKELKLAFSLAICLLGLTAAFMGSFVQKIGPVKAGLTSAVFFGVGLAGSGLAVSLQSLPLFYLFYGVISGIGLGFGYITPVSVVVRWFPEKPGFASGLVIMSFAAGSILASQLVLPLVQGVGVAKALYALAAGYFVVMLLASSYLALPAGTTALQKNAGKNRFTTTSLAKDVRFYGLWLMLFFNTTAGIALIAVAAPMARDIVKIEESAAIAFVGIMGLFNGLGRLAWSSVSDKIGRWKTFTSFFIIGAICFLLLTQASNVLAFQLLVFVIISCYGGAFATMPAFIKDIYGPENLSAVFGYVLTAWAAAAFAGPWLIGAAGSYNTVFLLFAAFLVLTTLLSFSLRKKLTRLPVLS